MPIYGVVRSSDYLAHYGIKGQKKGIRRWTNEDGTLNEAGKRRYYDEYGNLNQRGLHSVAEKTIKEYSKTNYSHSKSVREATAPVMEIAMNKKQIANEMKLHDSSYNALYTESLKKGYINPDGTYVDADSSNRIKNDPETKQLFENYINARTNAINAAHKQVINILDYYGDYPIPGVAFDGKEKYYRLAQLSDIFDEQIDEWLDTRAKKFQLENEVKREILVPKRR